MSGSVYRHKSGRWYVQWYHNKKAYKIYRYKGEIMHAKSTAVKLLSLMQSDTENGTFVLEKYTRKGWSDVIPFLEKWIDDVANELKPATLKGYRSYLKNHLIPFFKTNPCQLHEIQLDTLTQLMKGLPLSGKGKQNVMYCLHTALDYAWRSRKIVAMPPFPKKGAYQIQEPVIKWLPSDRQMNILEQIPADDKPIFYFLKYHMRRPGEACALLRGDVDLDAGVITIHRSISAREVVEHTKTKTPHIIPIHDDFLPYLHQALASPIASPYLFKNKTARNKEKRYMLEALGRIWKAACIKAGEEIDLYSGLKHSSCSQYINEAGLSESDLQIITDHARLDSVRRYAKTEVARKKELMMTAKVVRLPNLQAHRKPKEAKN